MSAAHIKQEVIIQEYPNVVIALEGKGYRYTVRTAVYGTVGFWGFMMMLGALFLMLISFGGLGLGLLLLI